MNPAHSAITDRRHRGKFIVLLGIVVLAVMALMGYLIWSGYREAIHTAETTSRNYAAIIEARLDATLRRAEAHLLELESDLPVAALSKQAVPRYARALDAGLDSRLANFPELNGLRVFDADGDLLYTTDSNTVPRVNIADRDYFRQLRDNPRAGPVFSEVVISRTTSRHVAAVAKAMRDTQGAFRGIMIASIELEYFQKLFQSLDVGARGVVAIHRSDDFSLVVRWPLGNGKINTQLPPDNPARAALAPGNKRATVEFSSSTDGIARIYSFHVLERYPFFVSAGLASEDVLAGWKERSLAVGVSGLMLLLALASLLYRLWRAETRQAQALASLAGSEQRNRDLIATLPGAVYEFRIDTAGRRSMPFVSEGIAALTGLSPAEIMADVEIVFRQIPAAAMPAMEQSIRVSLENLAPWLHEFPFRTTTGEDKWLRGHSIPRREADGSICWHGVFFDITARKQAEEARAKLAAIVENSNDAIISRGLDLKVLTWNAAAEQTFGFTAEEAIGQRIDFIIPDDERPLAERLRMRLHAGQATPPYDAVRLTKDGRRIDVSVTQSPIRDANDAVVGVSLIFCDITERKQAEQALRDKEYLLSESQRIAHIGSWLYYLTGSISWSEEMYRIYGVSPATFIPNVESVLNLIHPEDRQAMQAWIAACAAGEKPGELEFRTILPDGTVRFISSRGEPKYDSGGRLTHLAGTAQDITERKQVENALRFLSAGTAYLSGAKFFDEVASHLARFLGVQIGFVGRLLTPHNPRIRTLGLCIDGQIMPPVEYDLPGTPCEAVIGKQTAIFPEGIQEKFPEDRMLADLGVTGYAAVPLFDMQGRSLGHIGVMSRSPLSNWQHVEAVLRLFAVRVAAEIGRQDTEAKFHDLFEFSPDAILLVNGEGRIALANRNAERLFGYSREELLSVPVENLVPEAARKHHAELRAGFASRPTPRPMRSGSPDLLAQKKDGTTFAVDISLNPIETDDGMMVATTVHDITDRKALEGRLRQSQKMEAIGTLAGGIAHDFNNILAAIIGNAELARQDVGTQHPALASLDEIRKASRRAKELVDQILAFSRRQPQSRQPIALAPVVDEAVKMLRATLPAGVALTATAADDTPYALADSTQIHQVVLNLGTNAWHALESNSGCIDIRLEGIAFDAGTAPTGLPAGRYAHLSVRDSGRGMDAATLERVFEPFFTTKAVGIGTGLGLSVVHGIMQTHQGVVGIESAPGRGTTVHLYFPAIGTLAQTSVPEPAITISPRGRGQHVLYLDDEEALVLLVTRMLERLNYKVSGYTQAEAALAAVRADPGGFDVVVTDYNMPGMSGIDVAEELAHMRPDLPVMITSGYISDELRQQAERAGVRHLIYKPDTVEELCEAVRRLTDAPQ